ncbi:hypothetical protein BX616_011309, partial [Lobosporangium transversale]
MIRNYFFYSLNNIKQVHQRKAPSDMSLPRRSGSSVAHFAADFMDLGSILETTDLTGSLKALLGIDANHFDIVKEPSVKVSGNTLLWCLKNYQIFDYIYNRTFIQVSILKFVDHDDDKYGKISKASGPINPCKAEDVLSNDEASYGS